MATPPTMDKESVANKSVSPNPIRWRSRESGEAHRRPSRDLTASSEDARRTGTQHDQYQPMDSAIAEADLNAKNTPKFDAPPAFKPPNANASNAPPNFNASRAGLSNSMNKHLWPNASSAAPAVVAPSAAPPAPAREAQYSSLPVQSRHVPNAVAGPSN